MVETALVPLTIPKHSFIGWLAVINKLFMRDIMAKWGTWVIALCVCVCVFFVVVVVVEISLKVEIISSLNVLSLDEFRMT